MAGLSTTCQSEGSGIEGLNVPFAAAVCQEQPEHVLKAAPPGERLEQYARAHWEVCPVA